MGMSTTPERSAAPATVAATGDATPTRKQMTTIQTKILIPINLNPVASVSNTNTKDPNTDLTFKKPRSGSGEKKVEKGKEKSVKNKEKTEKGKEKSVPKKPTWDEM